MGPLNDDQSRVLDTCLSQCRRIQSLVTSVRHLERLQEQSPGTDPVDLDATIQTAVARVQNEFSEQDVRVRWTPARRTVLADSDLDEVLYQLIGNAARHADVEVVEVDLDLTRTNGDPQMWRLLVRDNGRGVAPPRREHLFNRLELPTARGSGLGLPLAATLIKRWGGRIWIEDTPSGAGAVFGIELVASDAPPDSAAPVSA